MALTFDGSEHDHPRAVDAAGRVKAWEGYQPADVKVARGQTGFHR
ncbi:MAG TPA: hypothetical protein VGC40_02530 [Paenirhodobacter sp.]